MFSLRSKLFSRAFQTKPKFGYNAYQFRTMPVGVRHASGLRQLAKKYGSVAVGTYLTLSFSVFCCCLASIQVLGIDQKDVAEVFNKVKTAVGIDTTPHEETKVDLEEAGEVVSYMPEFMQNPTVVKVTTTLLLATAMTKLFTPLKVAITVAIVPTVARTLTRLGYIKGRTGK
jgi:Protein of unknown function (DUF1279)